MTSLTTGMSSYVHVTYTCTCMHMYAHIAYLHTPAEVNTEHEVSKDLRDFITSEVFGATSTSSHFHLSVPIAAGH